MLGLLLTALAVALFIRKQYELSLLIFFGFITSGFQLIPSVILMVGAPVEKTTDLALLYTLAVLSYRFATAKRMIRHEPVWRWILVFLLFVSADAVYSYYGLGYELQGVIRTYRNYLCFLSFGVFLMVPIPVLTRVFHTIALITIVQCGLYIAQIPTGLTLLQGTAGSEVLIHDAQETGFIRFYNTPVYLTAVLFYCLFQFRFRSWIVQRLVVGLLLVTVLAPLHRTYIFSLVVIASLYILFQQSSQQRIIYTIILVVLGYGVSMVEPINNRLNKGFTDFSSTFAGGQSRIGIDATENTFAYRMAHLIERADYITQKPDRYIFGVGMLSEETRQAELLPFEVGIFDERIGRTSQINTGDIAWSLLILQLGFVGTTFFLVLIIRLIRLFYHHRSVPFGPVGLLTLLTTVAISFAGTELLAIPFRTMLVLLAVIIAKTAYRPPGPIILRTPEKLKPIVADPLLPVTA